MRYLSLMTKLTIKAYDILIVEVRRESFLSRTLMLKGSNSNIKTFNFQLNKIRLDEVFELEDKVDYQSLLSLIR